MLVGNQSEAAIAQMESMGFERSQIDRAMLAAFFNPDRAVDYLLNVGPESIGRCEGY
jgi:UV excision repair protein RAD23